jgi:hypothetical protein
MMSFEMQFARLSIPRLFTTAESSRSVHRRVKPGDDGI